MEFNQKTKLAELIGIILGDGNLHKQSNCITIVGSLEDIHYYKNHVISLFKELFKLKPKLRKRNDRNSYYLQLEDKTVFEILTKKVGLMRGNKINAKIPYFILGDKEVIPYFLRGLFDTDGCLKFSKQTKDKHYYPRIELCFRDSKFAYDIGPLLKQTYFRIAKWKDNRFNGLIYHQISGKENLERWFNIIKPANIVHISKYLFWKKFGYYIPKSSLSSRLKALNLNIEDIS